MRRKGFSQREFIVLTAVVVGLGIATSVVATNSRNAAQKIRCQNNLKQLAFGFQLYFADYDGRYPPVALANEQATTDWPPYGSSDAIQVYIHSARVNTCPASGMKEPLSTTSNMSEPRFTDYWFNNRLAEVKHGLYEAELPHPTLTICVGDGNDGTENNNARYNRSSVPLDYAPARRHRGGANYAFVDGHVKWLVPEAISIGPTDKNKPTLWPR